MAELSDLHSSCVRNEIEKQVAQADMDEPPVEVGTVEAVCETELKAYIAASNLPIRNADTPAPSAEDLINLDITPPKIEYSDPLEWWKNHEAFFRI